MHFTINVGSMMDFLSPAIGMGFEDLGFALSKDSISYAGLDLTHTYMMKNTLSVEVEELDPIDSTVLIAMSKLMAILKTLEKDSDCTITIKDGLATIKSGKFRRSLRMEMNPDSKMPKIPTFDHVAKVTTTVEALKRTLKRIGGLSDHYTFLVGEHSCVMTAQNESAEDAYDEVEGETVNGSGSTVSASFSCQYIDPLVQKALLPGTPVVLELTTDHPVTVTQNNLMLMIAPRIGEEE